MLPLYSHSTLELLSSRLLHTLTLQDIRVSDYFLSGRNHIFLNFIFAL